MLRGMKLARILLALLVLSGVAACGGSDDASSSTSVLNRGINAEPESLDAHKARSLQAADVLRDLGEGLVSFTATGELTAGAAESWEVSEDLLTYTFHIRPDARWSNGDKLTAEHFVFAVKRLVDRQRRHSMHSFSRTCPACRPSTTIRCKSSLRARLLIY